MTPTRDDWSQFGMPPDPFNGTGPGDTALMNQSQTMYGPGPFAQWLLRNARLGQPSRDDWSQFGMPPNPYNGNGQPGDSALANQSQYQYGR